MGHLKVNIGKQVFVRIGKSDGTEVLDKQDVRYSLHHAEIMVFERVNDRFVGTRLDAVQFRHGKAFIALKSGNGTNEHAAEGQEFDARVAGALAAGPQPYPLRSSTILLLSHIEPVGSEHQRNVAIKRRPPQRRRSRVHTQEF